MSRAPGRRGGGVRAGKPPPGDKRGGAGERQRAEKQQRSGTAKPARKRGPVEKPLRADEPPITEKLQKVLAEIGQGSRRELERWISEGRIEVNGERAHLGQRVGPDDRISVDGRQVRRGRQDGARILLYNKLEGEVCTRRDPENRPTVFDRLPDPGRGRWVSIGRLDVASSGLLLLTTDGALANRMMHPSTGLDREYAVRVNGRLSDAQVELLKSGIVDAGERLAFSDIRYYNGSGTNHWYHVALLEGRNREVRRLFESQNLLVSRLKRVRYGPVVLPARLVRGRFEELSQEDTRALYRLLGLPVPAMPAGRDRRERKGSVLIPYPELPAPRGTESR